MNNLLKIIALATGLLPTLSTAQSRRSSPAILPAKCLQPLSLGNSLVTATIQACLKYVGSNEIPIVAIEQVGDTTHYIISALIATYDIKRNPPTQIVKFAGREALLYTGKDSIEKTSPGCFQALLKKYSWILHVDKINRREGVAPDERHTYGTYDPILVDIAVAKDGHFKTQSPKHFPYIKYD